MSDPKSSNIVLISGGNDGIGFATVESLALNYPSYHIIIGSRDIEKGKAAAAKLSSSPGSVSYVQLDITSDVSIASTVTTMEQTYGHLDILINNAGVYLHPLQDDPTTRLSTRELYKQTFDVNAIGTACLTEAMLPLLKKSSFPRIVFVTSMMGSIAFALDKTSFAYKLGLTAYRASKAAANMLAASYSVLLEDVGGKSNAVCPGIVQTKINNYDARGTTVEVGAEQVVKMATTGRDGPTGTFSNRKGPISW